MTFNLINSSPKAISAFLGPRITKDKGLNPVPAIDTRSYWIQSHKSLIPDRFDFFSPSPVRLKVYQDTSLIPVIITFGCSIFLGTSVAFLSWPKYGIPPIWRLVVAVVALEAGTLAICWGMAFFDKHPAADCDEDWDPQKVEAERKRRREKRKKRIEKKKRRRS